MKPPEYENITKKVDLVRGRVNRTLIPQGIILGLVFGAAITMTYCPRPADAPTWAVAGAMAGGLFFGFLVAAFIFLYKTAAFVLRKLTGDSHAAITDNEDG